MISHVATEHVKCVWSKVRRALSIKYTPDFKGNEEIKEAQYFFYVDYMLRHDFGYIELITLKLISPGLKLFTVAARNSTLYMRPAFIFLVDSTRIEFRSSIFHRNRFIFNILAF